MTESVSAAEVSRLKKKIAVTKGLFTRKEMTVLALRAKGNESNSTALLSEMRKRMEEVYELYSELVEVCPLVDKATHEEAFHIADLDMEERQIACQTWFMNLPITAPSGVTTRAGTSTGIRADSPRFREQQGLRPPLLVLAH